MRIANLIKQINSCRRVHHELREQIEVGMRSKKYHISAEGLYQRNEQQFYSLLRCAHELDHFLEQPSIPSTSEERAYLETLLLYAKSLLKVIRHFPKLTYFFWQRSLGKNKDQFYERAFVTDWNKYQSFNSHEGTMFRRLAQFN